MKIDYKKPIVSSLFSIGITFIISMIMLSFSKPIYIMEVPNDGKGNKKINGYLLCNYSLLFASLVGIVVLLFKTGHEKTQTPRLGFSTYNPRSYKPVSYSVNTGPGMGT